MNNNKIDKFNWIVYINENNLKKIGINTRLKAFIHYKNNILKIDTNNTNNINNLDTNNININIDNINTDNNNYKKNNNDIDELLNNKINFIDKILWINLEKSIDRKKYMDNILKKINIINERIIAINGIDNNIKEIVNNNYARNMSNPEIACLLSHIKAINSLKNENGEYYMICEDDITFDNTKLLKEDLKTIITNAPEFDILMISKTYTKNLNNLYEKWSNHYRTKPKLNFIGSTACYIISKNGIDKIYSFAKYISDNNFEINKEYDIDVADIFLYKYTNTIVYKYNYISTKIDQQSTIHDNHINIHALNEKRELKLILSGSNIS